MPDERKSFKHISMKSHRASEVKTGQLGTLMREGIFLEFPHWKNERLLRRGVQLDLFLLSREHPHAEHKKLSSERQAKSFT